jgi:hypothetical protein
MRKGAFKAERQLFPLSELEDIREDYRELTADNPDGVKIIEKIALQHGTVIPGFGATTEFYSVSLEFRNMRSIVVFSSGDHYEADDVMNTFKNYIERE